MPLPTDEKRLALAKEVIAGFDKVNGHHPGFRPAHAKGITGRRDVYAHARSGGVVPCATF